MIKSKKIICLIVAAIAAFALGLSFNFANIGARADEIADGDFTVAKVSVRLADDQKGDGIRFAVVMKKSLYGEYAVSGNKTGVLILPEDLVGEELNLESENVVKIYTFGDEAAEDGSVIASKWVDCNIAGYEDYKLCVVYLYGIPKNSFNRPLTVRGFVQTAAGSVIYSGVKTKSLSEVALAEVADGNQAADKYLNSYTVKFIGENDEVIQEETKKYGERFTVPSAPAVDENSYFSGWQLLKGDTYAASADITDTTVKYSRTYKAEIKQYLTVTYLKVNGEQMGSCKVKEGGVPSLPATDKENFVINGWEIKNSDGSFTDFGSSYKVSNTAITENTVYRVRYNAVVSKAAVERGFTLDFNEGDVMLGGNAATEYVFEDGERLLHLSKKSDASVADSWYRSFDGVFVSGQNYEVRFNAKSGSMGSLLLQIGLNNGQYGGKGDNITITSRVEGDNTVYSAIFTAVDGILCFDTYLTTADVYLRSITVRKVIYAKDFDLTTDEGVTITANQMVYSTESQSNVATVLNLADNTIDVNQTGNGANFLVKCLSGAFEADKHYEVTFTFAEAPTIGSNTFCMLRWLNSKVSSGSATFNKVSATVYKTSFDGVANMDCITIFMLGGSYTTKFRLSSINIKQVAA